MKNLNAGVDTQKLADTQNCTIHLKVQRTSAHPVIPVSNKECR